MSLIRRRGLLAGIGAMLAAPAIIRTPGLLMPVKPIVLEPVIVGVDLCQMPMLCDLLYKDYFLRSNALFDTLLAAESDPTLVRIALPAGTWRNLYTDESA